MTPKKTYPGYYSIIRYIHEVEHGEFVNIGVILFCAETNSVQFHITTNYKRAIRFFSKEQGWSLDRFKMTLEAMNNRLTIEVKDHGKDFCNLIKFMQTRANQIEFSDLRGVVISDDIINEMGRIFIRTVT
jgi:hypothetical protein